MAANMRVNVWEANVFKAVTVLIVCLVVASQLMVGWKLKGKYNDKNSFTATNLKPASGLDVFGGDAGGVVSEEEANEVVADKLGKTPGSLTHMLEHLPPAEIDEADFKSEIVRPLKNMIEKFPEHPDMVIRKLMKAVNKEEERSSSIKKEMSKVRKVLGLEEPIGDNVDSVLGRRLKSVTEEGEWKVRNTEALPICPAKSPLLLGSLFVRQDSVPEALPGTTEFSGRYGDLEPGGRHRPKNCQARQKVAVVVPYRDRSAHLRLFLYHMHPVLQRQQLDYQIFVVEQAGDGDFNRAALMNVGFEEAASRYGFDCFIFQDVDLVPEDDRNLFTCPAEGPKHLAVAVNKWKYRLIYDRYFGGVTALSKEQFQRINGFSNRFYGWGGEDDDLMHRVTEHGYNITRQPANVARFSMLKHDYVKTNDDLEDMMGKSARNELGEDGLSTLRYQKLNEHLYPLYTWLLVKLPPGPPKKAPGLWEKAKGGLWGGMSNLAGGFAANVAKQAQKFASSNDEAAEALKNHIYR